MGMINKSLVKDTLREIWNTKSRFLSIFAIILVGVAFFAGLVASGPVMIETANYYFDEQDLADMEVLSTLGFTEEDLEDIENYDENSTMDVNTMIDVLVDENLTTRLYTYHEDDDLNDYVISEGRLPESPNEIALDDIDEFREIYEVGDTVDLVSETSADYLDNLTQDSFEVVGFVHNPFYIDRFTRGSTNIGTGQVTGFGVVLDEVIDLDPNLVFLDFEETDKYNNVFSPEYENHMDNKIQEYEEAFDDRAESRKQDLIDEANQELDDAKAEIQDARDQLDEGRQELEDSRQELDNAWDELEAQEAELEGAAALYGPYSPQVQAAQGQIDQARQELQAAEDEYDQGVEEFQQEEADAEEEIAEGEEDIAQGEEDLADLEALSVNMNFRHALDFPGLGEYGENADRIEGISHIFPVFFFALALLISLTTMSRMVDEDRTQIGTMKALGYSNAGISFKYFAYAFIATVIGSVLGLLLGFWLFPNVIVDAYGAQYQLPSAQIDFYWGIALIAFVGAILATSLATFYSLRKLLKENAATLLRPKAPKSGERILLERWDWFWDKLSFTHKVSIRNLFRYKGRMFMTIVGVSGGMALMLTGFGLSDSIQGIGENQFKQIMDFDAMTVIDTDAEDQLIEDVETTIEDSEITDESIRVSTDSFTTEAEGNTHDVTVMVPENEDEFTDYINLVDYDTEELLDLPENSAILTQKLAELGEVSEGDVITLEDGDGQEFQVEIAGVVEHYVDHSLYMNRDYYEESFGSQPEFDSRLIQYVDGDVSDEQEGEFEDQLADQEANMAVILQTDNIQTVDNALQSLEIVTVVLVISAGVLAFVVLYNLTNINVSERVKELSTIKVLGFYDKEVTQYVYRETFTLTIMGIIVGFLLGALLHRFVLTTVELDYLMFTRSIHWTSYLYASGLMIIFSIVVLIFMHFKLKNIDMVEALKAND